MSSENNCLICERIEMIKKGTNPYFVTELETGYVVMGDFQLFYGYTLLLFKGHVQEMHDLEKDIRIKFLADVALLGEAVNNAFKPVKMNYEQLGNSANHLHWHLFPRHLNDPHPQGPVWVIDKDIRYSDDQRPSEKKLAEMKKLLKTEIEKLI